MTVVAVGSVKGAPGVTTTALALAAVWPQPVLLAECDLAGGDLAAGYFGGRLASGNGLLELALLARRGLSPDELLAGALRLAEDNAILLLPGLTQPAHATAAAASFGALGSAFRDLGQPPHSRDVLIDCGRLDPDRLCLGLLTAADLVLIVLRPSLRHLDRARPRLTGLRRQLADHGGALPELGLLLIGDRPFCAGEVQTALGLPVLGVLADDAAAAAVLSDGADRGRGFERSALIRSARDAAGCSRLQAEQRAQEPAWLEPFVAASAGASVGGR